MAVARRGVFEDFRRGHAQRWIRVDGTSMRPIIPAGSWLLVDFGRVPERVGQVVIAAVGAEMVAHRVVARPTARRGNRIILKGDAELRGDPRVTADDVFGVVRGMRLGEGRITSAGFDGAGATAIAVASRVGGRIASVVSAASTRLPRAVNVALGGVATLTNLPVRILAAAVSRGPRTRLT
ncbi:MAG TPA: S24/S26 family peptidase [Candidatus Limnocylindria bacterium]|nr:S24/S26 family peptidase [Candidatus Limnocylindria bacterium]